MNTVEAKIPVEMLREQMRVYIERAGEKSLRMMQAIFEIEEEPKSTLSDNLKESVRQAIAESEAGMARPVQEIKNKITAWRSK